MNYLSSLVRPVLIVVICLFLLSMCAPAFAQPIKEQELSYITSNKDVQLYYEGILNMNNVKDLYIQEGVLGYSVVYSDIYGNYRTSKRCFYNRYPCSSYKPMYDLSKDFVSISFVMFDGTSKKIVQRYSQDTSLVTYDVIELTHHLKKVLRVKEIK